MFVEQERRLLNVDITVFSVGLPVPNKYALTLGINIKRLLAVEAEYFAGTDTKSVGGFDVASLSERLLVGRLRVWPTRKYFNVFAGYGVRWLAANVLTTDATLRSNVVEAGVGHRLDLGRLTLGADWLSVYVPVGPAQVSTNDPLRVMSDADRKQTQDTLLKLKGFPTIALFKLYLGINF